MAKVSARQWIVKVGGIDGNFSNKSGGNISSETNKVYDGGKLIPDVLSGPAEVDNITVSRPYDSVRDYKLLKTLRAKVGTFLTTISVTPTDRLLKTNAAPIVYSQCLLIGVTEPDADAASGDASTFELEFAVTSVK